MSRRIEGFVHFPYRLPCPAGILSTELEVELAGINGVLAMPGAPKPPDDGPFHSWLSPPLSASSELLGGRSNEMWGYNGGKDSSQGPFAYVHAAVMRFKLAESLSDDEVKERGEEIGRVYQRWLTLFWEWLESLNDVSYLDPNQRTDKHEIQLRGMMEGGYGQANIPSLGMIAIIGLPPASEETLQQAARLASQSKDVPLEHRLLAESRGALRLGDRRHAILDAATAAELALTDSVDRELVASTLTTEARSLLNSAYRTLGNRVKLAKALGIELPPKLRERLVEPRNKVVHRGVEVAHREAVDAVGASAEVIRALSPLDQYRKA